MDDTLDTEAMLQRFQERAEVVREGGMPPLEGVMRLAWLKQKQYDYQDFAMISDCDIVLEDGILTLTLDLRPQICDATIRNSPDGIVDKGPEQETQTAIKNIANVLPTDGAKIKMSDLDAAADLENLIDGAEMFKVVKTIEPIDVTVCPGFSLTHGYLA
jgi:hypothetical protein